jgi:hypothetical protein
MPSYQTELFQDQKQFDEAELLFKRALTIREKALPANHPVICLFFSTPWNK